MEFKKNVYNLYPPWLNMSFTETDVFTPENQWLEYEFPFGYVSSQEGRCILYVKLDMAW